MFTVFTVVRIDPAKWDTSAAILMLEDQLIPQIKQIPGFVKGTWFGNDRVGHGVVVFDTQEHATQAVQLVDSTVADGIEVASSDVYEVHAEA